MAKLIFYPLGNADSTLIHLKDDRLILKDYYRPELEKGDKRVDLALELGDYVKSLDRDYIDLVAFSHADDDHLCGCDEFFWFECDRKYQSEDRIKIKELHVPANLITEAGLENSAKSLQKEAHYRLRKGQGIRVHGYPEQLVEWFKSEKIDPKTREGLLLHAGDLIPGYSAEKGEVEIFIHSPFSYKLEEEEENRNDNSIVWHLTFFAGSEVRKVILGADATHQDWADIVKLTEINKNEDRLVFDLFRISHHCSYLSLSEDKGKTITTPREEVIRLFDKGNSKCILISSSWQILNEESDQPPHFQAKAFYKEVVQEKGNSDNFYVTMEFPDAEHPKPIIVETSIYGFTVKKAAGLSIAAEITRRQPPRVG
ncbi:MAG: hypothetical protein HDKAJFGB_00061 [Anaerolineae bacterium]|nr:hypothetical protein [Anaerolineae bacterium]